jgi:hypothetical protein
MNVEASNADITKHAIRKLQQFIHATPVAVRGCETLERVKEKTGQKGRFGCGMRHCRLQNYIGLAPRVRAQCSGHKLSHCIVAMQQMQIKQAHSAKFRHDV